MLFHHGNDISMFVAVLVSPLSSLMTLMAADVGLGLHESALESVIMVSAP